MYIVHMYFQLFVYCILAHIFMLILMLLLLLLHRGNMSSLKNAFSGNVTQLLGSSSKRTTTINEICCRSVIIIKNKKKIDQYINMKESHTQILYLECITKQRSSKLAWHIFGKKFNKKN